MKIWLIPASDDKATQNLSRSLENEIDVDIRKSMRAMGLSYQYAWGARLGKDSSNQEKFKEMKPGDVCFFYTADQRESDEPEKAYRWISRIVGTVENQKLADQIWPPFGKESESFPLIYFITAPIKIFITTTEISSILSANGKYGGAPKGFMSLRSENFDYVMQRFGSAEGLMSFVLNNFGQEDPLEVDYPELFSQQEDAEIIVDFVEDLLVEKKTKAKGGKGLLHPQRRSKQSKVVGDMAENFVYQLLLNSGIPNVKATQVEHVADQKLGWDIQYRNECGDLIRVEVKGSTAPRFSNFDLTINELNSLREYKDGYHFYLVGSCMSNSRKIQIITDMAEQIEANCATISPMVFRLELQKK